MIRRIRFLQAVSVAVAFGSSALATTRNSNGSVSDTQAQINASANGDTVLLPSGGSFSWASSDVTIPSSKYITLNGNGSTVTLAGTSLEINAHATGNTRVTNLNFVISGGSSGTIDIFDSPSTAAYRLDHCTITSSGSSLNPIINLLARGAGLIDHVTFTNMNASKEFMHINGWGGVDTTGWTTPVSPGSASLTYIEDCTFVTQAGASNNSWIQGYYGCRVVIRHCSFNFTAVDMHGTPNNIGARWWEMYDNTFTHTAGQNQAWAFNFRAGSGVIFNNTFTGSGNANIGLCEENSGYPADYQIGRGLNNTSDPAYIWNNTNIDVEPNQCDAPEQPNMVQENRDFFQAVKPGYAAYTYPHPLATGGSSSSPPNAPTGLIATP